MCGHGVIGQGSFAWGLSSSVVIGRELLAEGLLQDPTEFRPFDIILQTVRVWCNAGSPESVLLGMGQLLCYRAGTESTSQNKVTASKNYMLGLSRHAVPYCPFTY